MKYWIINKETREVIGSGDADKWNIPRNVLLINPLPVKEGFAVVANADLSGTEYVADHRGKIIYNKANPLESKQVKELGEIGYGWTLIAPTSEFDEWIDGEWVTNETNQTNANLLSQINALESTQTSRMLRSAALGDADSISMLQSIEDKIAVIRAQLTE